jgi:phage recombination protein Bet
MTKESTKTKKNVDGGREDRLISFTDEEKELLRRTVCKNVSDDEFKVFLHVAETYGLDPFNKELFFLKDNKDRKNIFTSRDGYLSIANRNEAFDGLVSDVVRTNDEFKRTTTGIEHKYGSERGSILGAYALVYRKDREYPVYVFAPFEEYNGYNSVWNRYPSAMILKVAESMALKRAFSVSGLVSQEEMDVQRLEDKEEKRKSGQDKVIKPDDAKEEEKAVSKSKSNKVKKLTGREKEIKSIVDGDIKLRKDLFEYLEHVKKMKGVDKISINDLSNKEYSELYNILQSFKRIDSKNKSA